jgi:hypothetical protein
MRSAPPLRAAALLLAAALALHQLRYLIAGHAVGEASAAVHGYLPFAALVASGVVVAAAVGLSRALARARRTGDPGEHASSLRRTWLLATGTLLALHLGQEAVEAVLAGRGYGPGAMVADGGLLVAPLAAFFGALVVLGLRGARRAIAAAARSVPARVPAGRAPQSSPPAERRPGPLAAPLALHLAGRAPPLSA